MTWLHGGPAFPRYFPIDDYASKLALGQTTLTQEDRI